MDKIHKSFITLERKLQRKKRKLKKIYKSNRKDKHIMTVRFCVSVHKSVMDFIRLWRTTEPNYKPKPKYEIGGLVLPKEKELDNRYEYIVPNHFLEDNTYINKQKDKLEKVQGITESLKDLQLEIRLTRFQEILTTATATDNSTTYLY